MDALLEKIQREGEDQASIDEIIRLARQYKFVTPYTSFLAVPRALLRPRVIRPGDPVLRVRLTNLFRRSRRYFLSDWSRSYAICPGKILADPISRTRRYAGWDLHRPPPGLTRSRGPHPMRESQDLRHRQQATVVTRIRLMANAIIRRDSKSEGERFAESPRT